MQLIALGSSLGLPNIGEPPAVVEAAYVDITDRIGQITACSRLYRTKAWPDPTQPGFVNAAIAVDSRLSPLELLDILLEIELRFGRKRSVPNAPRTLDLDLIADGNLVLDHPRLQLPHPRMAQRVFVLQPLADVAPYWQHPLLGSNVVEMLEQLQNRDDYDPSVIWLHT